jgi:hypothetical protein
MVYQEHCINFKLWFVTVLLYINVCKIIFILNDSRKIGCMICDICMCVYTSYREEGKFGGEEGRKNEWEYECPNKINGTKWNNRRMWKKVVWDFFSSQNELGFWKLWPIVNALEWPDCTYVAQPGRGFQLINATLERTRDQISSNIFRLMVNFVYFHPSMPAPVGFTAESLLEFSEASPRVQRGPGLTAATAMASWPGTAMRCLAMQASSELKLWSRIRLRTPPLDTCYLMGVVMRKIQTRSYYLYPKIYNINLEPFFPTSILVFTCLLRIYLKAQRQEREKSTLKTTTLCLWHQIYNSTTHLSSSSDLMSGNSPPHQLCIPNTAVLPNLITGQVLSPVEKTTHIQPISTSFHVAALAVTLLPRFSFLPILKAVPNRLLDSMVEVMLPSTLKIV